MILIFPDLDTLRLALTSGVVPTAMSQAPALASLEESGIVLQPSQVLPNAARAELRRLGVQIVKRSSVLLSEEVCCWAQLLPLQRDPVLGVGEQVPVLFDLPSGETLPALVAEMLRLGNDRQGYRWLEHGEGPGRALLRVVGPPYYSLLRSLERESPTAPVAYLERASRVWVEIGYRHPLVELLMPPAGQMLLLSPPRQWTVVENGPFRDIYEVLEFTLPDAPVHWREAELRQRWRVPLRLVKGGAAEAAEVWVLREKAVEQIDALVSHSDDDLIARLAFAVSETEKGAVIVLHVRPSKLPPPALVLQAVGFRPHLKLPNLFVPCGTSLQPPLRRDVVRKLLAEDLGVLTWLYPLEQGGFRPESLPETAFRPLADWVDYVLDHQQEALQAWVQSARFDFEPFICADEQPAKPKPPKKDKPDRTKEDVEFPEALPMSAPTVPVVDKSRREKETDDYEEPAVATGPDLLRQQLRALEERFLALDGPLDSAERRAMWPEMAGLNKVLSNCTDAGMCWMNALWDEPRPPTTWAWQWFVAEAAAVPLRHEGRSPRARSWVWLPGKSREIAGEDLNRVLAMDEPAFADVRALAAYVYASSLQARPSAALTDQLGKVQRFLEEHEALLPVRAAWLASGALARLAGGDVLSLARTRDRLLERLYRAGLRPDQDLPGFLRSGTGSPGMPSSALGTWLGDLCDQAREWVERDNSPSREGTYFTLAYVDMIFAFGLARLGERAASERLVQRAREVLGSVHDDAHLCLCNAFTYRIEQAWNARPHGGPLPAEQMEYFAHLPGWPRYVIDRLRTHSRILEPDQKLEPYRYIVPYLVDEAKKLGELADVLDRDELADRIRRLLQGGTRKPGHQERRANILRAVLDQAPRAGEELSLEILAQVMPAYDALPEPRDNSDLEEQVQLLEKGLFVAAHFDQVETIKACVERFQKLLHQQRGRQAFKVLEAMAGQCFRSLRKLGMRDEINLLLQLMADLVLQGQDWTDLQPEPWSERTAELCALLHVAANWYYFGRQGPAGRVLELAAQVLWLNSATIKDNFQFAEQSKRDALARLARVYVSALGQAPVDLARQRVVELFEKLQGVADTYTTYKHYGRLHLEIVEAVVLALVSEDFSFGPEVRRWLDDDEFLVRRRIHRDVRAAGKT
jgi:hypothetical protein